MLAAVPTWAVYSVLLKHRPATLPQGAILGSSTVFGLIWMAPLVLLSPDSVRIEWTREVAAGIAYIAVGASVVAFLSWNRGVAMVGPARAGVYLHLMPLFGAILAWVFLGERLYGYHFAGAALTFCGIAVTQARGRCSQNASPGPGIVSLGKIR
jgi:drug/metabolite transporter (DMT)-like permease